MNIEELGIDQKFNFKIFEEQSLEHIHPKSKVIRSDGEIYVNEDKDNNETKDKSGNDDTTDFLDFTGCKEEISEHCIGNLVLLECNKNSSVGVKMLNEKKKKLFDKIKEGSLLLHTIKIVTKSFVDDSKEEKWTIDDIIANKKYFENNFNECYKLEGV